MVQCPNCGREFLEGGVPEFCTACGAKVENAEQYYAHGDFEDAPERVGYCPFEDASLGFLSGFWTTCKQVLTAPAAFYRTMPPSGGLARPLLFAVILGWFGMVVSSAYELLGTVAVSGISSPPDSLLEIIGTPAEGLVELAVTAILSPFLTLISVFVVALILHGLLLLLGGATHTLECTIRVLCYSHAIDLLFLIPICAYFVVPFWGIALLIIGLANAHAIPADKAVIAVLSPILLLLLCCGGLVLAVFGLAASVNM